MGDAGRRSVQHCIQLVGQVVKHAADVVQDGHCSLLTGKGNVINSTSLAFSTPPSIHTYILDELLQLSHSLHTYLSD